MELIPKPKEHKSMSRAAKIDRIKAFVTTIEKRSSYLDNATLKSAMGSAIWNKYRTAVLRPPSKKDQSNIRSFQRYETLLREADRRYWADRKKPPPKSGRKLMKLGLGWKTWETLYDLAYEELEQILAEEPNFGIYLDRPVTFGMVKGNLEHGPSEAPRLLVSKSQYVRGKQEIDLEHALPFLAERLTELEELERKRVQKSRPTKRKNAAAPGALSSTMSAPWWQSQNAGLAPDQVADKLQKRRIK